VTTELSINRAGAQDGQPHAAEFAIAGELDAYSVQRLVDLIDDVEVSRLERIVFDLGAVEFCDSSGLAGLVRCQRTAEQHGVAFVLRAPPATPVRLLLGLSGLDRVFELDDG
jgi:anti-sigma B factor antagonist